MMSLLVLSIAFLSTGCDDGSGNNGGTTPTVAIGDELAGGFTVSYVDALGGIEADRDFDADGDDTIDEYQTLVSGRFGSNRTWSSQRTYYLQDAVFIGTNSGNDQTTLTIEAGTLIKGETSTTAPGLLVIDRGGLINAVGTPSEPIVFTSARAEGSKAPGDWGGIVINGWASINDGDDSNQASGEGATGWYGGTDDSDSSGTLSYVRVEFAGTLFSPDNELNGIAFQGVGRGTTVDYIQVHKNADDGVEFFGGCVNVKHIVITGADDDSLDWTSGWTGSAQYVILQQYNGMGDCGIEADSNKNDAAAAPVSDPTLVNFTMIGRTDADKNGGQFRRGTNVYMANSIMTGFSTNVNEISKSMAAGDLTFDGVLVDATSTAAAADSTDWNAAITASTVSESATLNLPAAALAGSNTAAIDVQPTAAPSATGVSAADLSTQAADANLDVEATTYFGAVDPAASSLWYAGWTAVPVN